jgi:putative hemolysin
MDDGTIPHTKNHFSKRWRSFWGGGSRSSEDVTEEEIISMVKEGHEQGVLLASEAEMIHNIFEFGDKEAKDIMTHRQNVIALDGNISYTDMVSFLIESGKSRYPVYLEDIDNIIGVLHIKDAFAFSQRNELFRTSIKDIPKLLREVEFIPETMKINTLFTRMQSEKSHLVIVVDEYGQTSGIVAMEDILEEIVGNIEDEHDEEEELIKEENDGSIRMDGMTDFFDVAERLELPLEKDAFETLNGFLISLLDKIPSDGETARLHAYGYTFEVLEVRDKIIQRVRVIKDDSGQV